MCSTDRHFSEHILRSGGIHVLPPPPSPPPILRQIALVVLTRNRCKIGQFPEDATDLLLWPFSDQQKKGGGTINMYAR